MSYAETFMRVTFDLSKHWRSDWTNESLAQELGVHPNTISNLRKGVDKISLKTLYLLSQKIGKPVDELLEVIDD